MISAHLFTSTVISGDVSLVETHILMAVVNVITTTILTASASLVFKPEAYPYAHHVEHILFSIHLDVFPVEMPTNLSALNAKITFTQE